MIRVCGLAALAALLSACAWNSGDISPLPSYSSVLPSYPEVSSSQPETSSGFSTSPSPSTSFTEQPLKEVDLTLGKIYEGASIRVGESWRESRTDGGAEVFEIDTDLAVMLQQIRHDGKVSGNDLLLSVMEALAPDGEYEKQAADGFSGMSCKYTRGEGELELYCVSHVYIHGKMLTALTALSFGREALAESALDLVLSTLSLSKV